MNKYTSLLAAALCCACALTLPAQTPVRCGTDMLSAQQQKSAAWLEYEARRKVQYASAMGAPSKITGTERVIPVVVHIIQMTPAIEISDARVQSQIDVLNEDFLKLNADTANIPTQFQGVAASCNIRFCLASIDPNGCPTTGINRVVAPGLAIHGIQDEQALKSYVQWDPHMYLNMWVPVNLKDNLLGYATFPTWLNFAPQNDGVVINGNNFGRGFGTPFSSYNLGRTATHEVGHWLGLYHTFEGNCAGMAANNCLFQGDEVCDTPPVDGPTYGCPGATLPNTCHESPTDLDDQTMNYMDYTDDACMYMYSAGQRDRVTNFLDNERSQIWSAANLMATGCDGTVSAGCQPIAAFESDQRNACVGATIQFSDLSFGPATSWDWTFQGGNPATSTLSNPVVTWAAAGTYAVTLRVSNGIGSDTLVENSFVTIAAPRPGPFTEGFEAATSLPLEWYTQDEDGQGSWVVSTQAGSLGQQSLVAHNFAQLAPLTRDEVVSHVIDLSGQVDALLTWDHAYKRRGSFVMDSLAVLVSSDCGATWQQVWSRTGTGLISVGGYLITAPWVPQPSEWRNDSVSLSAYVGEPDVRIMFRSVGGASQDIYIDNINLSVPTAVDGEQSPWVGIHILPNPSQSTPELNITLRRSLPFQAGLYDAQGRAVYEWPLHAGQQGRNIMEIPGSIWGKMAAGLYFLKVQSPQGSATERLLRW